MGLIGECIDEVDVVLFEHDYDEDAVWEYVGYLEERGVGPVVLDFVVQYVVQMLRAHEENAKVT